MIKVKGQISEMALCIEDTESRITDLARLFFYELSQKGNTIYNILPDAFSRLSSLSNISDETFRNIMSYLFSFVQKERQVETLVEKLCMRFHASKEMTQWRHIAYCLSLLNYNEKSIKKLNDLWKYYHDKLTDEDISNSFHAIVAKSKKFAKPEFKVIIEELEKRLGNFAAGIIGENDTVIKVRFRSRTSVSSE